MLARLFVDGGDCLGGVDACQILANNVKSCLHVYSVVCISTLLEVCTVIITIQYNIVLFVFQLCVCVYS